MLIFETEAAHMFLPPTLGEALQLARQRIDSIDARILLREASGLALSTLIAFPERTLPSAQAQIYVDWLARREQGEPVAYILGWREFYGRRFSVTPDTLIPRPDTELLVERVLAHVRERGLAQARVLDLGTGSGAIAVSLALENTGLQVTALDQSPAALAVAERNAQTLGAQVEFRHSDWFSAVAGERYDVVVSNPPYIRDADEHLSLGDVRYEPIRALSSGGDGLDDIRHIVSQAARYVKPGGCVMLEHGYDQAAIVRALLAHASLHAPQSWRDLAGIERVSSATVLSGD